VNLKDARRFPVVSLGAEYLTIGHLLRRNILAYKAPPNQEGYDLICINPDPRKPSQAIRVQVKSRYASDSNRGVMLREAKLESTDFVVFVFLNIGYFYRKQPVRGGARPPEFFTLPVDLVRTLYSRTKGGWERVLTKGVDLEAYRGDNGFELIAKALDVPYPGERSEAETELVSI
jgi:hypothetical protein